MAAQDKEAQRRLRYRRIGLFNRMMSGEDFAHYDFSDAPLETVFFMSADLTEAVFRGATLRDVDFSNAILTGADFSGAKFLGRIDFTRAILTDAIFADVDFWEADELIGAEFLTEGDRRGMDAAQAPHIESSKSHVGIDYLPESDIIDARTTTNWSQVGLNQGTSFAVPRDRVDERHTEVLTSITEILIENHDYFTLRFSISETQSEIEIRLAQTFDKTFRFDLDGLSTIEPELTSKRRIALRTMGWHVPNPDERIPTYHRDFGTSTPNRVLTQFVADTFALFMHLGYPILPSGATPVYKREATAIQLLIKEVGEL